MSNLHPEQRRDKNGRIVTRHVRDEAATHTRVGGIPGNPNGAFSLNVQYAHNTDTSGDGRIPVITPGSNISLEDRVNWHEADEKEINLYESYWTIQQDAGDEGLSEEEAHALAIAAIDTFTENGENPEELARVAAQLKQKQSNIPKTWSYEESRTATIEALEARALAAETTYDSRFSYAMYDENDPVPTIHHEGSSSAPDDFENWHVATDRDDSIYRLYWETVGEAEDEGGKTAPEAHTLGMEAVNRLLHWYDNN